MAEKTKRKQKPKKGRVVRITPDIVSIIEAEQDDGETISAVIRRLLGDVNEVHFVLPSDIYETVEDARGVAIVRAVKARIKRTEKPVPVKIVRGS